MKINAKIIASTILLCAVPLLLTACMSKGESSSDKDNVAATVAEKKPFAKYKNTVKYTVGKSIPGAPKLPKGDSYENNVYTRYIKKNLNAVSVDKFEAENGDNYDQKVAMAISTGDLPDIMAVNQSQLQQLVDNDLIQDLSSVYKTSTTKSIKKMYDSYGGRPLKQATFNGKLMALPTTQTNNLPTMLWVRKDWMDKLGLAEPKTIDDVENILEQFVTKDPGNNGAGKTIGLGLSKTVGGSYASLFQADDVMSKFNSFPRQWIKQDGKVVYGSTTPETKKALGYLQGWFKKGLIDPQMSVRDKIESIITSGQCGAFFGPWWSGDYPLTDAYKNNPKADWQPYVITDKDGKVKAYTQNTAGSYFVVRKGFKHPELLAKIASLLNDKLVYKDYAYKPIVNYGLKGYDGGKPVDLLINYATATTDMHDNIMKAVNGKRDPKTLILDDYQNYKKIKAYNADPANADNNAWSGHITRDVSTGKMKDTLSKIEEVHPVFFGQTPTMKQKWANLNKMEDATFLKIVTNQESVDKFDDFVKSWHKLGGDEITKEVKQEIKSQN